MFLVKWLLDSLGAGTLEPRLIANSPHDVAAGDSEPIGWQR